MPSISVSDKTGSGSHILLPLPVKETIESTGIGRPDNDDIPANDAFVLDCASKHAVGIKISRYGTNDGAVPILS